MNPRARDLLGLAVGFALGAYVPGLIAVWKTAGNDASCISVSGQAVCKGQSLSDLPVDLHSELGGVVAMSCDFKQSFATPQRVSFAEVASGCGSNEFVLSLSNGTIWTNFWVRSGKIVRIDQIAAITWP